MQQKNLFWDWSRKYETEKARKWDSKINFYPKYETSYQTNKERISENFMAKVKLNKNSRG